MPRTGGAPQRTARNFCARPWQCQLPKKPPSRRGRAVRPRAGWPGGCAMPRRRMRRASSVARSWFGTERVDVEPGADDTAPAGAAWPASRSSIALPTTSMARMAHWPGFYERVFGFRENRYFDLKGEYTGLTSKTMTALDDKIPHSTQRGRQGGRRSDPGIPARQQRRHFAGLCRQGRLLRPRFHSMPVQLMRQDDQAAAFVPFFASSKGSRG